PVKGLSEPVEVYELTGAGPARTRLQATERRGLTRFVGREAELEQLRHARELALDGRGQVVAIVGDAGVGKSRLVHEFLRSHHREGWRLLETALLSYSPTMSYQPVVDLLRTYLKVQDRDGAREIREKVTGTLLALDDTLKPALPALLSLLGVSVDNPVWPALDPVQRRQRTVDAITHTWLKESQVQPLLVVVEDLHWIDAESQAILDRLVEHIPAARLLLLVNHRPEYHPSWEQHAHYLQIRLDALQHESARALLEALLAQAPNRERL